MHGTRIGVQLTGFLMGLLAALPAGAISMSDFAEDFVIDLEHDSLPSLAELENIVSAEDRYYDAKYHTVWDLTGDFDETFYARAATYGSNEKRLKWEEEDQVLEMLANTPKEYYQYVGPMLFEVPNMSEKVLNMPGIKETKNRFPTRVAEQLKDMEDIEFLSPAFYFLLMPEVWPENHLEPELPHKRPILPSIKYDPAFFAALQKLVPPEDFMPNAGKRKPGRSDLRTINPTAESLLTAADVAAVARTLPKVDEWYQEGHNRFYINRVAILLWNYESQQRPEVAAGLREIVNPCARLVIMARLLGQELALAEKVADEGFTLNEWAYTCDKTIKAYRLSRINRNVMNAIRLFKAGTYDKDMAKMSPFAQSYRYAAMQAWVSGYNAPLSDVREVQKKRDVLEKSLRQIHYRIGNGPVRFE